MILNLGSLTFNTLTSEGGGTPAWGTEMGQGEGYRFAFEDMENFLPAMVYNSVPDIDKVTCPLGKGGAQAQDYEFVLASIFKKVFVNGIRVKDADFLLLIVKKLVGAHHVGRRTLKYNPRMTYRGFEINHDCYNKMAATLGLSGDAAWFVNEIYTKNQDELHFVAYILGEDTITYGTNEVKKNAMLAKLKGATNTGKTESYNNTNVLQEIYFGTPGSGKSNKVKKLVAKHEEDTFRTTFHPDTDYASFVGSYKPVMVTAKKTARQADVLTQQELTDILRDRYNKAAANPLMNNNSAIMQFGIEFYGYFNGKIASYSIPKVANDAIIPGTSYDKELYKAVNIGPWVEEHYATHTPGFISYEFVPQAFTDAYVRAWQNLETPVYLVIEEINRGNCAQIFGDLFQLLDRGPDGKSEYPVKADKDLCRYLETILGTDHEGIKDGNLRLPANLHILATMNTSDQSLFPMDSAFKRRWAWKYVPIDADCADSQFKITIGDKTYKWSSFLTKVNKRIHKLSDSEDKQMGNFFIKTDLDVEDFKSKVMFYLWSEVCKEYEKSGSFFKNKRDNDTEFTFNSLFPTNEKTNSILQGFMEFLEVEEV